MARWPEVWLIGARTAVARVRVSLIGLGLARRNLCARAAGGGGRRRQWPGLGWPEMRLAGCRVIGSGLVESKVNRKYERSLVREAVCADVRRCG